MMTALIALLAFLIAVVVFLVAPRLPNNKFWHWMEYSPLAPLCVMVTTFLVLCAVLVVVRI
jgi:hypothetical protein